MHLQDVDMNAPVPTTGKRPQVPIGLGTIDWGKTFSTAKVGGVKNYFVEQSWELTQQSVAYLKSMSA
jgi:sugar phosphate isomerase/epimerase